MAKLDIQKIEERALSSISMVKCKPALWVILVLLGLTSNARAQDVVFSQFYAAPLLLNPAFAGTSVAPSFSLNHRSQYVGIQSTIAYQTYSLSYSQLIKPIRSGVGVSLMADDAGDNLYNAYSALAYYSYQIQIDKENSIRIGVSAGMQNRRLDWDRLIFFDQLDNVTGQVDGSGNPNPTNEIRPDVTNINFADFGAGLLYAGKTAYAGISLDHLTTPDDRIASLLPGGFYKGLPMRIGAHAGTQIDLNPSNPSSVSYITPNVLYTRQGPFEQVNLGAYASVGAVFGGAWFRHTFGNADAAIAVLGVKWDMYKFGYSYDATVSGLSSVSSGTHEVSLQVNFDDAWWVKEKRKAQRYNDCLNLFR